jgi:hypothetical protein
VKGKLTEVLIAGQDDAGLSLGDLEQRGVGPAG